MKRSSFEWDGLPESGAQTVTVQVTLGMRTARDLHSALLEAVYGLTSNRDRRCLCLLVQSGFTRRRLKREVAQFKQVLREDLANRIEVLAVQSPADLVPTVLPDIPEQRVHELQAMVVESLSGKSQASSREAVVGQLLRRWIGHLPPVRITELAGLSGASLPTVYAALKSVDKDCLLQDDERQIALTGFSARAWQQWLSVSSDRPSVTFVDRSGSPRSPEKLARLFSKLERRDMAIGGVLGARHHFPGLDITAAPHLDVVVDGGPHTDLSFISQLDPGLVRKDAAGGHTSVVIHFANRTSNMFEAQGGAIWADALECMIHMWSAGLVHQVEDLIANIAPVGLKPALGV